MKPCKKQSRFPFVFPKNMKEAKRTMRKICKLYGVRITYDNKYKNFLPGEWNQAASHNFVECAFYQEWNYDLLVFDVLHELGHLVGWKEEKYIKKKGKFCIEFAAWRWAIDAQIKYFGRNPSIRQAANMLNNMKTYTPAYENPRVDWANPDVVQEREGRFWCPIQERVLKKD